MAGRYVGDTAVGIAAAVRPAGRRRPRCSRSTWSGSPPSTRGWGLPAGQAEQVRAEAKALADQPDLGEPLLAGVPVAVKDSVDLAGVATRSGSAATSQEPADADAEPVRRLREAGALLVGKTSLPELGLWPFTESTAFGLAQP